MTYGDVYAVLGLGILTALFFLSVGAASHFFVLRSLSVSSQRRREVLVLVCAAEQLYGAGRGESKRRWVRENMHNSTDKNARTLVEWAVWTMKQSTNNGEDK